MLFQNRRLWQATFNSSRISGNVRQLEISRTQFAVDFQVHMLDLRNHGRSMHSDDLVYEIMAQDVYEYCHTHNLETSI
jgi:hypothetical protein